jgi:heme A synthase
MESNPYAPPAAHVADHVPNTHGLKHRSLWLMLVFFLISLGFYYVTWFFRRRAGLNRLESPRKLPMWPLLLTAAFFGMQFVLGLVAGFTSQPVPDLIGPVGSGMLTLLRLVVGVTMIIQCFGIKDIIQDHATPQPDPDQRFVEQVQLSGLMTFFFSIFYLQWAINKYVVGAATR